MKISKMFIAAFICSFKSWQFFVFCVYMTSQGSPGKISEIGRIILILSNRGVPDIMSCRFTKDIPFRFRPELQKLYRIFRCVQKHKTEDPSKTYSETLQFTHIFSNYDAKKIDIFWQQVTSCFFINVSIF